MRTLARLALTVTLSAAVLGTLRRNAHAQACGMGEVDWYGAERAAVARAETLLQEGEPVKAAAVLQRMWPRLREALPVASSQPVIAEGVRVMALALARSDGDVGSQLGWSSRTPAERSANVAWGVSRLRMLSAIEPDNAAVRADLGEALSRDVKTRAESRRILEALASTGSLWTAESYAALAHVRLAAGDDTGAQVAATQCEGHASNATVQCDVAGGRVARAE